LVDIAVRETDIPPNPDDDDELPSFHFPLQTHNRPPSPPQFRDFRLPSAETRRPEDLMIPSGLLGMVGDGGGVGTYNVPFRVGGNNRGFGRRVPGRSEGLNPFPGSHQQGRIHPGRGTSIERGITTDPRVGD